MPNCDFYALKPDLEPILRFIFDELPCRVFESYSAYDSDLTEFTEFDRLWNREDFEPSIMLQLWPVEASRNAFIERIDLKPECCEGATYRYSIEGWGLVQLYLEGETERGIRRSHTNHNSERRAAKWSDTYCDRLGDPADWDWPVVTSVSRKLNRQIRKHAVAKIGSRVVLPHAKRRFDAGVKPLE